MYPLKTNSLQKLIIFQSVLFHGFTERKFFQTYFQISFRLVTLHKIFYTGSMKTIIFKIIKFVFNIINIMLVISFGFFIYVIPFFIHCGGSRRHILNFIISMLWEFAPIILLISIKVTTCIFKETWVYIIMSAASICITAFYAIYLFFVTMLCMFLTC